MVTALLGALALAPQTYSTVFPRGTLVRLVAVAEGGGGRVWSPNGKPLKANPLPPALQTFAKVTAGNARLFVVQVSAAAGEAPSVALHLIGGPVREAAAMVKVKRGVWDAVGIANHGGRTADVRIGVADGPWKRLGSVAPVAGGALKRSGVGFIRMARPDPHMRGDNVLVEVALPVDPNTQTYRVRAFDRSGKPMPFILSANPPGSPIPDRYWFRGRYEAVGRVELQARTYAWKTFKGVHVQ